MSAIASALVRAPDPRNVRDMLLEAGYSPAEVERMFRGVVPGALIDDHASTLIGARDNLRADYIDESYGNFGGGDPRDFRPDPECSTPEERERHRLACEAADRGDAGALNLIPGSGVTPDGAFAQFSDSFGLGTTTYPDVDRECLIHNVERMCELVDPTFTATALPPLDVTAEEFNRLRRQPIETPPRTSPPTE